jgi:hypothetical protein
VPGDLVFRATVESIECSPIGIHGAFLDWIVRTRVEAVVSGDFTGEHFAFRVHSPSRAGLEIGKTCTVHATWTGDGYLVDEHQWRGAPHRSSEA